MAAGKRSRRAHRAPRDSYEELEIRTSDGVALRAIVTEPPRDVPLRGTCVMAHALFARKTAFGRRERPGLAQACAAAGYRAIAFDFRGHGDSALPPGREDWSYDELVRFDLPAVVACAKARGEERPVIVLGHSLGGHTALASQGTGRLDADGIVAVGASVWLQMFEPSSLRWAAKRLVARGARAAVDHVGRLPARLLHLGSDDASAQFASDFFGFLDKGAWESQDGTDDYAASLARVAVPVAAVASEGDHLVCHPDSAAAFVSACKGPVLLERLRTSDDGSRPPGHVSMVTTPRAEKALLRALGWVTAAIDAQVSAKVPTIGT
ncbi:MAG: hydrolase of the alpha/beta superfamily [Labilithrix sp.]|nr:hydrolase of the alpha/beta superfamily [Labilithrix sp.]